MRQVARLAKDYRIIVTHGNGPQVGDLLLMQEGCATVPKLPLEILVAQTQGQIGYMIESTLDSEFMALGKQVAHNMVSLISYVVVDDRDPAFAEPTKPIGRSYTREEAASLPFPVRKTAKGYRRVAAAAYRLSGREEDFRASMRSSTRISQAPDWQRRSAWMSLSSPPTFPGRP